MNRRTRRAAQDDPRPDTEVAATASAIVGLRRQLRRLGTIEHPAIRRELRKLEEQLSILFEQAGRNPGRHRAPAGKAPSRPDGDAEPDVQPDTAAARGDAATTATTASSDDAPRALPAPVPELRLVTSR